ncbi:MAG TPA: LysR family transcriptional regulator [Bradyrhizobium sp.]|jgi:DNA-binding transcriptional LysR family regulator|nr:LysR family transcriptional regulator [Bradyrhizobium sp.]
MPGIESIRGVIGFVRTVAAGSFAGAAKELGVSPVAVSKNVQRLERRLGVRLLQRSTRKLNLTEEGRLFHERCIGPLKELESAQSAVKDKGRSAAGTLRLTSISPFGRTYVLPLLPEFSRLYPDIEVELHLDDAISDMIAEGYDIGIRAGEIKDATMIVREIAPLHFVVCGAPSYLAGNGIPKKPADLASHNCLRLRSRAAPARALNWLLGPDRAPVSPPVRGNFLANDITALVTAAVHGHGLVLAPLPSVLPLFRSNALVPLLPDSISQPAHLFIHYPNRKHLPARVRSFVNFALDRFRKNPDLVSDPQRLIAPFVRAK